MGAIIAPIAVTMIMVIAEIVATSMTMVMTTITKMILLRQILLMAKIAKETTIQQSSRKRKKGTKVSPPIKKRGKMLDFLEGFSVGRIGIKKIKNRKQNLQKKKVSYMTAMNTYRKAISREMMITKMTTKIVTNLNHSLLILQMMGVRHGFRLLLKKAK